MKKIVLLVVFVTGVIMARAQFFKKMLDNVKQTVQNRANGKANQTTNHVLDKVDSGTTIGGGSHAGSPAGSAMGSPGGLSMGSDTSSVHRVLGAFARAAQENPNDTSAADLTMKGLGILVGGGGVSAADSAKAIQAYRTANGGSGVFYQTVTVLTGKMNRRDTSSTWLTSGGEGRKEMTLLGSDKIVTIGRMALPNYSMLLDAEKKTYSLTIIDTSLLNRQKYKLEKLGTETVLGYSCRHVRLTPADGGDRFVPAGSLELWVSTDVPGYSVFQHGMMQADQTIGIMRTLHSAGADGFFVKMMAGGKDTKVTMQLLQVRQGAFPAALFEIPAGYAQSNEGIIGQLVPVGKKP